MKNITRHVGTLRQLKRLPSSVFGNPRYQGYVAGFHFRTRVDSAFAYTITNYLNERVIVEIGTHYGYATLVSIKRAKKHLED